MAAKATTAHRPSQSHMKYVTTRDGRRVLNTAYAGGKKPAAAPKTPAAKAVQKAPEPPQRKLSYHLIAVDTESNANKEYRIWTNPDGTVTAEWGRVGADNLQSKNYPPGSEDSLAAKKMRGKKTKDGVVRYEPVATVDGGSAPGKASVTANLSGLNPENDPEIRRMVDHFAAKNKHAIESFTGGSIKVDDDGIARTAVGVIRRDGIDQARAILTGGAITDQDAAKYLRLVPQKTRSVKDFADRLRQDFAFNKDQEDLLGQLEAGLDVYEQRKSAATDGTPPPAFRHTIRPCTKDESEKYRKMFTDNIDTAHTNTRTMPKIKNVFAIDDHGSTVATSLKAKGERARLAFHGTAPANCLSLTTGGLKGPSDLAKSGTTPRYTGSMFSNLERRGQRGNGVYLAQTKLASDGTKFGNWGGPPRAASKSLGYASDGAWLSKSSGDRYLYVVEAYTGSECRSVPNDSHGGVVSRFRNDPSYDSIVVKAGDTFARNDEMVVPAERCRIVAVLEIA